MRLIRLSKLMSERGICSRREADRMIEKKLVRVDGAVVSELGTKVSTDAKIELLPTARKWQSDKVTIILHKPVGYVSTQPEKGYRHALDLITPDRQWGNRSFCESHLRKLSAAGRLDIDSKGLLVFTQDGVLAKQLIGIDSVMEKEYLVRVEGQITPDSIRKLRSGLYIDDSPLKPAKVQILEENLLKIILTEGKKRQIRKMCQSIGLKVVGLKRVRIGSVLLGDLPMGRWRYLQSHEKF